MPAWVAPVVAGIASVVGSYLSSKRQSGFDATASDRALNQLSTPNMAATGNWLFPGLLPEISSTKTQPKTYVGQRAPMAKAEGGPVETGEDYLVGEEGPELFRPEQDGTVIPNPSTLAEGQGMDPMVQMLAEAIAQALMQVFGGGGGPPMDGGMPPMGGMPPAGGMPGLPGRARGGPVRQGETYQVGEQGPEAFVPTQTQPMTPGPSAGYANAGEAYTGTTMDFFNQPGALSPATYYREQEQANQAQNLISQGIQGSTTGAGLDPNSPFAQSLQTAGSAAVGKMRTESARDFSLAQDQMRRQDIAMATQNYLNALQQIFGIQQSRAAAAGGQDLPQVPPIYPYQGIGQGVAYLGYGLGNYFGQKSQQPGATEGGQEYTGSNFGFSFGS